MFAKKVLPKTITAANAARHGTVGSVKPEPAVSSKQKIQSKYPPTAQSSIQAALSQFDAMPDSAYVRQPVVLSLFGCSKATLWRWVKSCRAPSPKKIGIRMSAWNVGELRQALQAIQGSHDEK